MKNGYYWYGIAPSAVQYCSQFKVTHVVFIMGEEGFVRVPVDVVLEFLKHTRTSNNPDGTIRHYHCLISPGPEPELYYSQEVPRFPLRQDYQAF